LGSQLLNRWVCYDDTFLIGLVRDGGSTPGWPAAPLQLLPLGYKPIFYDVTCSSQLTEILHNFDTKQPDYEWEDKVYREQKHG
jgi:hypothetical protein